jgi:hypothetical protein
MNIYELSGTEHDDNFNLTLQSSNSSSNSSTFTTTSITPQNGFYAGQS